ncbi:MAG: hypothetical protein ACKVQC_10570 [Elusimicrobiota bacterium]
MSLKNWFGFNKSNDKESSDQSLSWNEKRKQFRLELDDHPKPRIFLLKPESGEIDKFPLGNVKNISLRGCRMVFQNIEDVQRLKEGQIYSSSLEIEDFSLLLQLKVVRFISKDNVAFQFVAPFPKDFNQLEWFVEPKIVGQSLREIDPTALQQKPGQALRWFQGVNETHLFIWFDQQQQTPKEIQLVFMNNVFEWDHVQGIKTGKIKEDLIGEAQRSWVRSELIEMDSQLSKDLLKSAKSLISSSTLEGSIKKFFLELN